MDQIKSTKRIINKDTDKEIHKYKERHNDKKYQIKERKYRQTERLKWKLRGMHAPFKSFCKTNLALWNGR